MRRTKLLWFAAGAATSALAAVLSRILIPVQEDAHPYLAIADREYREDEVKQYKDIASTSGQLLNECGARQFFVKLAQNPHDENFSLIKISQANKESIKCILEKTPTEGFRTEIQWITDLQVRNYGSAGAIGVIAPNGK